LAAVAGKLGDKRVVLAGVLGTICMGCRKVVRSRTASKVGIAILIEQYAVGIIGLGTAQICAEFV